jgi:hypothetical protein
MITESFLKLAKIVLVPPAAELTKYGVPALAGQASEALWRF